MRYIGNVFRPPSEAGSFLLQATLGCSHNKCTFCGCYPDKPFRVRRIEEVLDDIETARDHLGPDVRRVFLCDGNALILPTDHLVKILDSLKAAFPSLQRVGVYANAQDILRKPAEELGELVSRKMTIFYLGLESGSDRILEWVNKGSTADEMVEAVRKAMKAGMKSSVIYLIGLGGRKFWREHALESARAISKMDPTYLSALTITVIPGTPLADAMDAGSFELPTPEEFALELKVLLENVDVKATVFRSNHASNYVPLAGRLPRDTQKLIDTIDAAIRDKRFRPEYLRGL